MKILISGGKGQLAYDCDQILRKKHEVISMSLKEMDITSFEQVEDIIDNVKPDILLNCAAYTKVDACETNKELAWKVNVTGPENLAKVIEKLGGKLIHFSSDYVFNGKKKLSESYMENDHPEPSSYYGKTKLESERVIKKITERYIIVRTAWLYGISGQNFLKTMLKQSLNNPQEQIKVVNDQFGSVTWSYRLVLQIEKIIEVNGKGTYHATAERSGTWFEVAEYFLQKMKIPHKIIPCTTQEYPTLACRPANSILENQRLKKEGINLMIHWKSDIDLFVSDFRDHLIKEAQEAK